MKIESIVRNTLIIVGILLLQTTFLPYISLAGYLPDLFVYYLVFVALRQGQIESTVFGFVTGLLQDIVAVKFLGLAALSKTIAGFIVGYFFNENTTEQTLGSYRYILLMGLFSIIQDILYFTIFLQGEEGPIVPHVLELTLGMTLYTCIMGILPMLFFSRKYKVTWMR